MPRLSPLLVVLALGVLACERKEQPAPAAQAAAPQSPAPARSGPILIGSVGSLTGPEASFGAPVRDGIRDALAKTKDFPSVSGTISLDADRNPMKPAVILKIQGGKRVFAAAVTP